MAIELQFPSRQLIEEKHDRLIERYGGLPGVRDENALGSAIARAEHLLLYREGQLYDLFDAAAGSRLGDQAQPSFCRCEQADFLAYDANISFRQWR